MVQPPPRRKWSMACILEEGEAEMSRVCGGDAGGAKEFMLLGVKVVVDAIRKSVSMKNLS